MEFSLIPLLTLSKGQLATIKLIDDDELSLALLHLGIKTGDILRLSNIAPLGDPIAIAVNGTKISIRKKEAARIWVLPVDSPQ